MHNVCMYYFLFQVACSVAQKLKARYPRVSVEASGNITETNVAGYMGAQIDIISTSRLCHGYSVTDVSMKLASQTPAPAPALSAASLAVGSKRPATGKSLTLQKFESNVSIIFHFFKINDCFSISERCYILIRSLLVG